MEYNDATQVIDDESEEDDGDAEQWAVSLRIFWAQAAAAISFLGELGEGSNK